MRLEDRLLALLAELLRTHGHHSAGGNPSSDELSSSVPERGHLGAALAQHIDGESHRRVQRRTGDVASGSSTDHDAETNRPAVDLVRRTTTHELLLRGRASNVEDGEAEDEREEQLANQRRRHSERRREERKLLTGDGDGDG